MKAVRNEFDSQLIAEIKDGNVVINEVSLPPALILGIDPIVYEDEFSNWFNSVWLPEREALLGQILSIPLNRQRFDDLCKAIDLNEVVPFVGAGMSIDSGFKEWGKFLKSLLAYATCSEADLDALLQAKEYEAAANLIKASMPPRLFEKQMQHQFRLDPNTIGGAVRYLPIIFSRLIVTTNFDRVLEAVFEIEDNPITNILYGNEKLQYVHYAQSQFATLIKIHGDYETGRVFTTAEYDAAYANGSILRRELELIFRTKSLLFLGSSLTSDRTIKLMQEVAEADDRTPDHYVFHGYITDPAERLAREHFLTSIGIFPIWFEGDHSACIEALMIGIARRLDKKF